MESVLESPLDVLSLAATMVRRHDDHSQGAEPTGAATERGEAPRRDGGGGAEEGQRRRRLMIAPAGPRCMGTGPEEGAPLDMRRRCLQQPEAPPQHLLRPSVITCAPSTRGQTSPPLPGQPVMEMVASSGDDPDIDEHFRRSLGSDYVHLFSRGQDEGRDWPPTATSTSSNGSSLGVKITGNSVDDHFAKALGDTWRQLQQLEESSADECGAAQGASRHVMQ